ncbi:MAG: hypothetical protein QXX59_00335 [Candidatus Bathyarchaeia archaeon]
MKRLEWDKKVSFGFIGAVLLIILLILALNTKEIKIAENTTLKPITWTFQRPSTSVYIDNRLNASYIDDELLANMTIIFGIYHENDSAYNGNDHLSMALVIDAMAKYPGHIENIYILFQKDFLSKVCWMRTYFKLENLSLEALEDGHEWKTQAYIKLKSINQKNNIHAESAVEWSLLTVNTQSHRLDITFEMIYYNGTAYNKVVQPFQLNMVGTGA